MLFVPQVLVLMVIVVILVATVLVTVGFPQPQTPFCEMGSCASCQRHCNRWTRCVTRVEAQEAVRATQHYLVYELQETLGLEQSMTSSRCANNSQVS